MSDERMPLVVGNWKMNTNQEEAVALASAIASGAPSGVDLAVCPPFPWLVPVAAAVAGSAVTVGAQNCWKEQSGAVTGEVAPAMLVPLCRYVILGHSERRQIFEESDSLIAQKITAALAVGLQPIICVGESLATRRTGDAVMFVREQVVRALGGRTNDDLARCTIAYEPIWAIGTGEAATPEDAQEMASAIRATVRGLAPDVAPGIRILYGGSVNAGNAEELLAGEDVDGALVGGASLKADAFLAISSASMGAH
ncbi:MAG TPA: triose-phosphate isomerase [Thermomicrobiales bacterium]|nr:triose-phosphate isomerase [Thermomicrobiales bacterium]